MTITTEPQVWTTILESNCKKEGPADTTKTLEYDQVWGGGSEGVLTEWEALACEVLITADEIKGGLR